MKSAPQQDSAQAMQRVRVGMTGLAMMLVLIALASIVFSSASRDEPVAAIGASNSSVVDNITDGNAIAAAKKSDEPLVELGLAPSTASTEDVNAAEIAKRLEAERQAQAAAAAQQAAQPEAAEPK